MALSADAKKIEAAQEEFFKTMKGCRVGGDQNYTHNALVALKGKFMVNAAKVPDFFSQLCELIALDGHSGMMEKNEPRMPVLVDNDFDFKDERKHQDDNVPILYEDWVVTDQVQAYQESLKQYCTIRDPKSLVACVFEKSRGYIKKGLIHNGFHLMFPFAVTDDNDQQATLAPGVKRLLKEKRTLERMAHKDVKEKGWDEINDPGLPKKTWVMYGCRKDSNMEPYRLTAIYDQNMTKIYDHLVPESRAALTELFNPLELSYVKNNLLPRTFFDTHPIEYYLPVFFSIRAWDSYVPLRDEIKAIMPTEAARKKRATKARVAGAPVSSAMTLERGYKLKDVRILMDMLSASRADKRDPWMHVAWCLWTITNGSNEGLDLWIEFSKRSAKYKDGECDELWSAMGMGNWSVGSLRFWAREDSPQVYANWCKTEESTLMTKALSLTHFDVAKFVQKTFDGLFVCASLKHTTWYEFKDHRWRVTDRGASLYDKLSNECVQRLDAFHTEMSRAVEAAQDEEEKVRLRDRMDCIHKLIKKLKDTTYKNKLMSELSVLCFDQGFLEKLDENPDLLVCRNGVLDIKLRALRPGVPEDYCSKSTKIDFPMNYTWDTPEVRDMETYMRKVFPSEGIRKYMRRFAASVLRGGNSAKLLPEWIGHLGNNSKSMYTDFFVRALGDYCIKFPSSFFTGKNAQSGACTPELERAQGARIGFCQEPDASEKMNISRAKEVTGGDSVYVRGLYQNGRSINLMLKWCLVCNHVLPIPASEIAVWNRIRLIPFESNFCFDPKEVPATEEEQIRTKTFEADPYFQEKIPRLAPAFLWLLWQELPAYMMPIRDGGGLCEPPEVTDATAQYKNDSDSYSAFVRDKVEAKIGSKVTIGSMYKAFNGWYRVNYPSIVVPPRLEMRDALNRIFKKPSHTEQWIGLAIKADEAVDLAAALEVAQVDLGAA